MRINYLSFILALILWLGMGMDASAQKGGISVSGVVADQSNVPLIGVSIRIQDNSSGTVSSSSGSFHLEVPKLGDTLVFSYLGYGTQHVAVISGSLNVTMYPANGQKLNEVVVIGYGAVRKQEVSGAITTLDAADFQKGTVTSFDQMIQGKAAGLSVTPNGGHPGSGGTIRIRGLSSLNGSQDPLVVVDGMPFGGYVNPNDIASVTILKDAASAAIYGSQASGGVILITTKKGQPGELKMNFNTQVSVGTIPKYADVLNADQFRQFVLNSPYIQGTGDTSLLGNANTNWQKEIYRPAVTSNSNLSILGSIGKSLPFRASFGYLTQQGILETDKMNRGTGSVSLTPTLFDGHLKVEVNLNGSLTKNFNANQGAIGAAVAFDPTQPVYDAANNMFGGYYQWMTSPTSYNPNAPLNPVALLRQRDDESNYNRGFGNVKLDYSLPFLPELHLMANWGYDIATTNGTTREDSTSLNAYKTNNQQAWGMDNPYYNKNRNLLAEYTLSYDKFFPGVKSHINAMAMYSYEDTKYTFNNYRSYDYKGDTIPNTTPPLYPNGLNQNTLISFLGRLIYTYDERYTLTASFRRDGSSKLAPGHRWVSFPSLSLAWDVTKEDFLKNSSVISLLKPRLSYGKTANQGGISDYSYYPGYYLSDNQSMYEFGKTFYNMYTPAAYNAELTWETTGSINAGVDFGFLGDRISGTVDVYHKKTTNLLVTANLPAGTNFTNQLIGNVGEMKSEGIEVNLKVVPIQTNDLKWTVNINAAYNESKITKLTQTQDSSFKGFQVGGIAGATGQYIQEQYVGHEPNSFLVYKQVYDTDGKPIEGAYVDLTGDGAINPIDDQYFYHSPYPKWLLGFSTQLDYKKWTFSTVLRANIGNYVYNNVASNTGIAYNMAVNSYLANASSDILHTGFVYKQQQSDYYVQNASFLKMDNLGISYQLGDVFSSGKTNLTLSANVQNVFTVTKYHGINPEIYSGIDNNVYPVPRVFTFGVNLDF